MNVVVLSPEQLNEEDLRAWSDLQEADPRFSSPFFRPEFTVAAAGTRTNVFVGIIKQEGKPIGFFPFERGAFSLGRPVGGRLNDFHGVVAKADAQWSPNELIAACGLRGWSFENVPRHQEQWLPHLSHDHASPTIELGKGFEAYYQQQRSEGGLRIVQFLRKLRKIEREVGEVRFEAETRDPALWQRLLEWKKGQYAARRLANPLVQPRWRAMLEAILACDTPGFRGHLSALFVKGEPVAVLLAMRSHRVLHYWIPTFDSQLSKYSPGSLLLMRLVTDAESLGIDRIDLGPGDDEYKQSFATTETPLIAGAIDTLPGAKFMRGMWGRTRSAIRNSSIYASVKGPAKLFRSWVDRIQNR